MADRVVCIICLHPLGQKAEVSGWSFTQIVTLFHFHDLFTCYSYTVAADQTTFHDNSHDASQQVMRTCASESSTTPNGIPVGLMHRGILIHTWRVSWPSRCGGSWSVGLMYVQSENATVSLCLNFSKSVAMRRRPVGWSCWILFTPGLCGIQN